MLKTKFLVIMGDEASCKCFSSTGGIGPFLHSNKNKYRSKKVIDLTKPKRWTEPEWEKHDE